MACAILERTSGLEPSSETTAPRYLKLVTVPNFCLDDLMLDLKIKVGHCDLYFIVQWLIS